MQHKAKILLLILIDILVVAATPFLSLYVRLDGHLDITFYNTLMSSIIWIVLINIVIYYLFGLYNRLWRYASVNEAVTIINAVTVSSILVACYIFIGNIVLPKSIHILSWFSNVILIGISRFFVRIVHHLRIRNNKKRAANVLIIGAGDAGAMIAREIKQRYYEEKTIVGFIDDDEYKFNQRLFGTKVLGTTDNLSSIVEEHSVKEIIIAMPSVPGNIVRGILKKCKNMNCSVKTVPGLYELIDGKVTIQQLRSIDLEDLLRRDPVHLDLDKIASYLKGKRILVTGAGGSIGSELCRQIAKMSPDSLILLGKGENSIYEIHRELTEKYSGFSINPIIADVRDEQRINDIFQSVRPQVVFHAAAHKHVPLMEAQPGEAVRNNILGTNVVAEAADRVNTNIFVMISTDKAVNPSSVMGATKRAAEMVIQNLNRISNTKFVAVRFGNVLGSRGSVIPLFKRQIARGGPITITHPEMCRYFMTIPEATQLVLQAGSMAQGGEVFVLDMGEPVKILEMACDLIELSGLRPYEDIQIQFTGLRPGEKLFEELLTAEEGTNATRHKKIYIANLKTVDEMQLQQGLRAFKHATTNDEIIAIIDNLVPTYKKTRLTCSELRQKNSDNAEFDRAKVNFAYYKEMTN